MKILFLDDDPVRIGQFLDWCPHEARVETTAEGIIEALQQSEGRVHTLFLDHDLGGEVYVDSDRPDCGMEVVRFLCQNNEEIGLIVVHTHNEECAKRMVVSLSESGYCVFREGFGSAEYQSLASLKNHDELRKAKLFCETPLPPAGGQARGTAGLSALMVVRIEE